MSGDMGLEHAKQLHRTLVADVDEAMEELHKRVSFARRQSDVVRELSKRRDNVAKMIDEWGKT